MSDQNQNIKVAHSFREALWSTDDNSDLLDKVIAPGCVVHGRAPFATGFDAGQIAIRQLIEFYRLTFSEIQMTVERTTSDGDLVTLLWRARARHTGDLLGAAPTNREVETTGMDLLRFEDGRIAEGWIMWDEIGLLGQLFGAGGGETPDLLRIVDRLRG
ncbi:MAG: putative ester cyclase [Verrucomicrobiales bacterium]|jgi:predicted ester cyclase